MEKLPIFGQNHGLTRLETSQCFDCFNFLFLQFGKGFFFLKYSQTHFPGVFFLGEKEQKNCEFFAKTMDQPFQKNSCFLESFPRIIIFSLFGMFGQPHVTTLALCNWVRS